jgi:hypothetical protein
MAEQPKFLSYANRKLFPRLTFLIAQRAIVILTILLVLLCLTTEFENAHFETFFPRRPEMPESKYLAKFEIQTTRSDGDWRNWQAMMTGDTAWYSRALTPSEIENERRWMGDAQRWNWFVYLVNIGVPVQLGLVVLIWIGVAILCQYVESQWDEVWRTRIGWCALVAMFVAADLLYRGYFGVFFNSDIF